MKSTNSVKKETKFICNSDGSSSTVSLCHAEQEQEGKSRKTADNIKEDCYIGQFKR